MDRAQWLRLQNRQPDEKADGWFRFKNTADGAEVLIYDEIGAWGITAKDFVNQFEAVQGGHVTLRINSPGGDVFDGLAIMNSIKARGNTTTVVDGVAASAASYIFQAGTTRMMHRNSQVMIHCASGLCIGNAVDMRSLADLLEGIDREIADIYTQRAGGTLDDWLAAMGKETWYSAQQAVDNGLADAIVGDSSSEENGPTNRATTKKDDAPDMDRLVALIKEAWAA